MVFVHLILVICTSKRILLRELTMLHFVWTVDWREETTRAMALAYILNLTRQENKIVFRARQLCLDTVSQHTFPWSSEPWQRHLAACDTVSADSLLGKLFITPLLVYLVAHTPAWKNLHNSPRALFTRVCLQTASVPGS